MLDEKLSKNYIKILREELIPAMGCTEPIALAYAGARTREILGVQPEKITVKCSGNMIKNVRCVQIPNSGGLVGIEAAVVLGVFGGRAELHMEVLERVTAEARTKTREFLQAGRCGVEYLDSEIPLHFIVEAQAGGERASVEVQNAHTNIVSMKKNGEELLAGGSADTDENPAEKKAESVLGDRSLLSIEGIKAFADQVDLEEVRDLLDNQIKDNMDIAYEGMSGNYGLSLGRTLRECYADSTVTRMKAYAAAASEARMDGCDMPVIINSGSGNQGIASTVPVIVYAREENIPRERLYRALIFASLLTTHQKEYIGKLSAFCGAVSASCASGAAITYMIGGTEQQIKNTIENTLANIPGIICDGAKISCAAKIATCIDAAMMAHFLAMKGGSYEAYTGIIKEQAEETISCVGYIGKVGMKQTDKEIIKMML